MARNGKCDAQPKNVTFARASDRSMALNGCSSGLLVTGVVALLLLPTQYYVPHLYITHYDEPLVPQEHTDSATKYNWSHRLPPLDLSVTITLLCLGLSTYLCEWIQRKMMEKRIIKLNEYLCACVERLRTWDVQQQQQEATLRLVHAATCEYNILLYLLMREHKCMNNIQHSQYSKCYINKTQDNTMDDVIRPAQEP